MNGKNEKIKQTQKRVVDLPLKVYGRDYLLEQELDIVKWNNTWF